MKQGLAFSSPAQQVADLKSYWENPGRWNGIQRPYSAEDVVKLRPSLHVQQTHAQYVAEKLWKILSTEPYVDSLGAITGAQAVQMAKAG
ncbi:MAG: isocitrate lyase, partial [Bdellovibrio sp.]